RNTYQARAVFPRRAPDLGFRKRGSCPGVFRDRFKSRRGDAGGLELKYSPWFQSAAGVTDIGVDNIDARRVLENIGRKNDVEVIIPQSGEIQSTRRVKKDVIDALKSRAGQIDHLGRDIHAMDFTEDLGQMLCHSPDAAADFENADRFQVTPPG